MNTGPLALGRLREYLRASGLPSDTEPELRALTGGQSNPTFVAKVGSWQCVLRTKPPGQLAASAHAIDREYRVMNSLRGTGVPVPHMLNYCSDATVLGREFFLMEFVQGRTFVDQTLPGMDARERGAVYDDMNRVIAQLHSVAIDEVGLDGFGKPGNYFARQIGRWTRQCEESSIPVGAAMRNLMEWLPEHIPAGDETTVVHGDFRLDNMIFHPTQPRVIALLDWELSTLGHPLADFSYQCMAWHIPPSLWRGVAGTDLASLGIPDEKAYRQRYTERTGRSTDDHWHFYIAYNLFRMAAILHGIAARAQAGNAASADAVETGAKAGPLALLGWATVRQYASS